LRAAAIVDLSRRIGGLAAIPRERKVIIIQKIIPKAVFYALMCMSWNILPSGSKIANCV